MRSVKLQLAPPRTPEPRSTRHCRRSNPSRRPVTSSGYTVTPAPPHGGRRETPALLTHRTTAWRRAPDPDAVATDQRRRSSVARFDAPVPLSMPRLRARANQHSVEPPQKGGVGQCEWRRENGHEERREYTTVSQCSTSLRPRNRLPGEPTRRFRGCAIAPSRASQSPREACSAHRPMLDQLHQRPVDHRHRRGATNEWRGPHATPSDPRPPASRCREFLPW